MGVDFATYFLAEPNHRQGLISDLYKHTSIIYNECLNRLLDVPGMETKIRHTANPIPMIEWRKETRAKGHIHAFSSDNPHSMRGNRYHRVCEDESPLISDTVEDEVITPTLARYGGQHIKIGTPHGRNHFYRSFMRGIREAADLPQHMRRAASFRFPSTQNPYLSAEFLAREKATKPDRAYRQEYLAEFLTDAGGVFSNVENAIDAGRVGVYPAIPGRQYVMGWDVARHLDFSVVTVIDLHTAKQVYHHRMQQTPYSRQMAWVQLVAGYFNGAAVWMDSTGLGDPLFEALRRRDVYVRPYVFTNASKERLIDNLAMLVERGRIRLMDLPEQTDELELYSYRKTPSGNITMGAPDGGFDDCVSALALAAWSLSPVGGWATDKATLEWLLSEARFTPERDGIETLLDQVGEKLEAMAGRR